ncbi:MAG: glycosyltransferase [Desulfoarculaceae bacterium]|nr:glycosyltransferase [Desulfoarculaceae bacterium]
MNIMMMTNTFTPHIGGVARSVERFTAEYRRQGHRVLVVAPKFEKMPENEMDVVRIPAIQHFNGSDFSVVLPVHGPLASAVEDFHPDIIHAHHPFLLGGTALRMARRYDLPLIFTHHTMYEQYTHYVPGDSQAMKQFVIQLSTSYANFCDLVFAPSQSVAEVLQGRGVRTPIEVVPTGVDVKDFARGSGPGFRAAMCLPADAFIIGHLGRLAPEKNLEFLATAVAAYLQTDSRAHFLLIGSGPSEKTIKQIFARANLALRLHHVGLLEQPLLASSYQAMDLFAFASRSETQGMVLTEAMAAGVPVVALDAPGVREVVVDGVNGRLLQDESHDAFVAALQSLANLSSGRMTLLQEGARSTAWNFSHESTASRALALYEGVRQRKEKGNRQTVSSHEEYGTWEEMVRRIRVEWDIFKNVLDAADAAFHGGESEDKKQP